MDKDSIIGTVAAFVVVTVIPSVAVGLWCYVDGWMKGHTHGYEAGRIIGQSEEKIRQMKEDDL